MRAQEINNMMNINENTEAKKPTEIASPVECLVGRSRYRGERPSLHHLIPRLIQ